MPKSDYPQDIREAIEWFIDSQRAFMVAKRDYEIAKARVMLDHPDGTYGAAECHAIIKLEQDRIALDDLDIETERRGCWLVHLQRRPE